MVLIFPIFLLSLKTYFSKVIQIKSSDWENQGITDAYFNKGELSVSNSFTLRKYNKNNLVGNTFIFHYDFKQIIPSNSIYQRIYFSDSRNNILSLNLKSNEVKNFTNIQNRGGEFPQVLNDNYLIFRKDNNIKYELIRCNLNTWECNTIYSSNKSFRFLICDYIYILPYDCKEYILLDTMTFFSKSYRLKSDDEYSYCGLSKCGVWIQYNALTADNSLVVFDSQGKNYKIQYSNDQIGSIESYINWSENIFCLQKYISSKTYIICYSINDGKYVSGIENSGFYSLFMGNVIIGINSNKLFFWKIGDKSVSEFFDFSIKDNKFAGPSFCKNCFIVYNQSEIFYFENFNFETKLYDLKKINALYKLGIKSHTVNLDDNMILTVHDNGIIKKWSNDLLTNDTISQIYNEFTDLQNFMYLKNIDDYIYRDRNSVKSVRSGKSYLINNDQYTKKISKFNESLIIIPEFKFNSFGITILYPDLINNKWILSGEPLNNVFQIDNTQIVAFSNKKLFLFDLIIEKLVKVFDFNSTSSSFRITSLNIIDKNNIVLVWYDFNYKEKNKIVVLSNFNNITKEIEIPNIIEGKYEQFSFNQIFYDKQQSLFYIIQDGNQNIWLVDEDKDDTTTNSNTILIISIIAVIILIGFAVAIGIYFWIKRNNSMDREYLLN